MRRRRFLGAVAGFLAACGVGRPVRPKGEPGCVQLRWTNWGRVCEVMGDALGPHNPGRYDDMPSDECGESGPFIAVTIPQGGPNIQVAHHGDWIIRDRDGRLGVMPGGRRETSGMLALSYAIDDAQYGLPGVAGFEIYPLPVVEAFPRA